MMWDDEVDVVCCGSGFGALASAIAAEDAGLEVLVARSSRQAGSTATGWTAVEDQETRDYFDELSADLGSFGPAREMDVPIRVARELTPAVPGAPIEPFYGARLRDWAARCLTSPYGVLYTHVADRGGTLMKTGTGEEIQVQVVGAMEADSGISAASAVNEWLLTQTRERDLYLAADSSLERIVFEEGQVLGAVIDTADGPLAVRARHGVAVSTGSHTAGANGAAHQFAELGQSLQICIVSHSASRFGRVELLSTEAADKPQHRSSYCRTNRVHDGLREASRSHARRCREVHRYPPLG